MQIVFLAELLLELHLDGMTKKTKLSGTLVKSEYIYQRGSPSLQSHRKRVEIKKKRQLKLIAELISSLFW